MIRIILCLSIFLTVSGCASTYKLNQNILNKQKTMSVQDAKNIIASNLSRNNISTGICDTGGLSYRLDSKSNVLFQNNIIYIKNAFERGKEISRDKYFINYEKIYVNKEISYLEINKIRIQLKGDTHFCHKSKGENIFQAFLSPLQWFAFDVRSTDIDNVIAALTILNPDVKLITGTGF